ncbi:TRAP transporter large permease subunit, partial [Citrobacter sp. AAK_AS5]
GASLAVLTGLAKRSLSWAGLRDSVVETLQTTAALFILAIGANMLTRFMAISGAGKDLAAFVDALDAHPMLLLLGIALIYLV